jgi:hypothetical protein
MRFFFFKPEDREITDQGKSVFIASINKGGRVTLFLDDGPQRLFDNLQTRRYQRVCLRQMPLAYTLFP